MRTIGRFVALAVLCASGPALAAPTHISDPKAFVTQVYHRLATDQNYTAPEDIYTAHLKALFADEKHDAGDEVGRVDFDFWTDAQDWSLKDPKVREAPVEGNAGRKVEIVTFLNSDRPEEIHFYFQKTPAGWLLDDARSVKGESWTLSVILKYGWDGQ
ncbi:MAG: hypothetical protein ACHP84_13050 [Caulobacterales bacterium]